MSAATVSYNKKRDDGALISVGGTDAADFLNNLAILLGDDGVDAVKAEIVASLTPAAAGASIQQATNVVQAAFPAAQSAEPADPNTTCRHGARRYKEGIGKKGKWSAYFCGGNDRNDECQPIWG